MGKWRRIFWRKRPRVRNDFRDLGFDEAPESSNNRGYPVDLNRRPRIVFNSTMRFTRRGGRTAVINIPLFLAKGIFLLLLPCLGIALSANAASLFDQGSSWRWRPGTTEASSSV